MYIILLKFCKPEYNILSIHFWNWVSIVSIVTRLQAGQSLVQNPAEGRAFSFLQNIQISVEAIQPPIQWTSEALSLGVKWRGCEAAHSRPSSAEVNNE
jgi:hypothetical protein